MKKAGLGYLLACVAAVLPAACASTTTESTGDDAPATDEQREIEQTPVTIGVGDGDGDGDGTGDGDGDGDGPGDGDDPEPGENGELPVFGADPKSKAELWVPDEGDFVLRDEETGTLWNLRGQAYEGELKGAQLGQVPAYTVFWFSWSTAHHGGEVWNRDELNSTADFLADGEGDCTVPCNEIRSGGPPPDGIPALDYKGRWDRPFPAKMVEADAVGYLNDSDFVVGVSIGGEARAYSHKVLNWHEIHIDEMGGVEYNMTYCPLTGSAILIPVEQGDDEVRLFISGRLFNDNLTMFQRDVDLNDATFWNQVLLRGIAGPERGERLTTMPVVETTWGRWKEMHPETLIESDDTGYSRNYGINPYVDRQTPDAGTLGPVSPAWESTYANKDRVLAIDGPNTSRAYAFPEMDSMGDRLAINDELDGTDIVVVYEAEHRMAIPYSRELDGQTLTFEGATAK